MPIGIRPRDSRFSARRLSNRRTSAAAGAVIMAATVGATGISSAALVVVDVDPDAQSVIFSHLSTDQWQIESVKGPTLQFIRLAGDGEVGRNSLNSAFTQGSDLNVTTGFEFTIYDHSTTAWTSGAGPDLNYARMDLDNDSVFETVVEFDFGPDESFGDDVITRYVYDDTGADLNISDGLTEMNIPEPGTVSILTEIFGLGLVRRRRLA